MFRFYIGLKMCKNCSLIFILKQRKNNKILYIFLISNRSCRDTTSKHLPFIRHIFLHEESDYIRHITVYNF